MTLICGTDCTATVVVTNYFDIPSSKVTLHFPIEDLNVKNLGEETYIPSASYKIVDRTYY